MKSEMVDKDFKLQFYEKIIKEKDEKIKELES